MQAELWKPLDAGRVRCLACVHGCVLPPGEAGICGVRYNRGGSLGSLVTGGIVSAHADPVEKKPLYHFLPGTLTYSFGTEGCNFACTFCQNADISQHPRFTGTVREQKTNPADLVRAALASGCASVAFTYTEPTVFIELTLETADKALQAGLGTVMVSNGYQSADSLNRLQGLIQAANIDLKSMRNRFYHDQCGGSLKPVLDNLVRMLEFGWWVEVTTLLIPGLNDDQQELEELARFIVRELGRDVPWHVTAFHSAFSMRDRPRTPPETVAMACAVGREAGLSFVYPGNVPLAAVEADRDTRCPECGSICLRRNPKPSTGFSGFCPACNSRVPGLWRLPEGHEA